MSVAKAAAGFVVFRRYHCDIEYLLMQTSYGIGHWTPPKGHIDSGESAWDAAVRETEEEAGLVVADLNIFKDCKKVITYPVENKPKTVTYWLAELINQDANVKLSDEHRAYKWLPYDAALEYANFQEMIDVIKEFHEYIQNKCDNPSGSSKV